MDKLRVGVIGLSIGQQHLLAYQRMAGVEIAAVGDIAEPAAKAMAEKFHAQAYTDGIEMLEKEKLNAVSICTPPASHFELTEAAAKAGTHVLCEKPMAPSVADCDRMIRTCAKAEVTLMIGQKKRFHPFVQKLKKLCDTEIGPVRWAVAKYALGRVGKKWFWEEQDGGGPLLENSIHTVDQLRYLMGEVVTVYAEGDNLFMPDFKEQLDCATYTFRFANGAIAAVGSGMASEWGFANEYFFFACDKAEIRMSGPFDRSSQWWMGRRSDPAKPEEETLASFDAFGIEIDHFLHCVRTGEKPLVTGEDGRGSVAVCLAVKKSARTGKPVTLGKRTT